MDWETVRVYIKWLKMDVGVHAVSSMPHLTYTHTHTHTHTYRPTHKVCVKNTLIAVENGSSMTSTTHKIGTYKSNCEQN